MKKILIYRHPDCARCARYARVHRLTDWFNRIADTTATPPTGPLQLGQIVVEELATGRIVRGAESLRLVWRQVILYWPFLPLLWIPAIRARADRELGGFADGCQPAHSGPRKLGAAAH